MWMSRRRRTITDSSELISGCRFTHGWNRSTPMSWLSPRTSSIGSPPTPKSGTICTLGTRATTWCTTSRSVTSKSLSARKNRFLFSSSVNLQYNVVIAAMEYVVCGWSMLWASIDWRRGKIWGLLVFVCTAILIQLFVPLLNCTKVLILHNWI